MARINMQLSSVPILQGKIEHAIYRESPIIDYRGNPLVEALPPIYDVSEVVPKIAQFPSYDEKERNLKPSLRLHCVMRIADFVQPLSIHLDIEQRFSRMIRHGYKARNPMGPDFAMRLRNADLLNPDKQNGDDRRIIRSSAAGFSIIGISGIGKTTTVETNLLLYPQVIIHSEYADRNLSLYQVVWLKLECPHDGSTKSLCLNFFQALDSLLGTNYFDKYRSHTENVLISLMARVASLHCLGVLVIDEIQNLSEAKSGGSNKMLNFFVQLVNTIGVPVVLVGTYKATFLLGKEFRKGRRGTGHQGGLVWSQMEFDDQWDLLMERMWRYQWTAKPSPLTPKLKKLIYDESQGITDIAIKLYMLAQWRAISTGVEEITPNIIKSVAKDSLKMVKPALDALKSGKQKLLMEFGDIRFPIEEFERSFDEANNSITIRGNITDLLQTKVQTQEVNNKVTRVATWLIEAGIEPQKAQQVAERLIVDSPETDLATIKQKAYSMCCTVTSELETMQEPSEPGVEKNVTASTNQRSKDDLREIVAKGRKHKFPPYEALAKAGYIKHIDEFLTG